MTFNSLSFFVFFPIVTIAYFALPHRFRWPLLLVASCCFYMAFIPAYILILFFTIAIDYVAGILIEGAQGGRRRLFLMLSIVANIGVLAVFKYANFLIGNLGSLARVLHWLQQIPRFSVILPIGLSFHTFQSLSYTIEVYRGRQAAERHLGVFGLYVMFYPQLVAGPIERPQNMLHQFHQKHAFDYNAVSDGLRLMMWGLFKKAVIADRLAVVVDRVYNDPTAYKGPSLIIATLCFAYQIYCDFSGYSDMALGAAQVMGFRLMRNFDQPYSATSISEFWRRWHISLSTWFRDYLYIPLGGNRVPGWRRYVNLLCTFLVSGLWHGAAWSFVIWGGLHGCYQVLAILTQDLRRRMAALTGLDHVPRLQRILQRTATFSLVSFAWVFFRANSVSDALYVARHLVSGWEQFLTPVPDVGLIRSTLSGLGLSAGGWLVALAAIAVLEAVQLTQGDKGAGGLLRRTPGWLRWGLYYVLALSVLVCGVFGGSQFIYFQF